MMRRATALLASPKASPIHKSIIPTYHFQPSLPRLPIPKLEDTLNRYEASVSSLVQGQDLKNTMDAIQELRSGVGPKLQQSLVEFDKAHRETSYYNKDWFAKYLADRSPLPISTNPYLVTVPDPNKRDGVTRAASVLYSAVLFRNALRDNTLPPELFHTKDTSKTKWFQRLVSLTPSNLSWYVGFLAKAYALDMSQHSSLFHTTRIPHALQDELRHFPEQPHAVVFYRGRPYKVNVTHADGNPLSPGQIAARLQAIVDSNPKKAEYEVGILTAENRDDWAKARDHLEKSPQNAASLKDIDSALLTVALDDWTCPDIGTEDNVKAEAMVEAGHHFLHARGHNRWFDKSITLIFTKDGTYACNFEHAWGDGVAVLRFVTDTCADAMLHTVEKEVLTEQPVELTFELDDISKRQIKDAETNINKFADRLRMNVSASYDWHKHRFSEIGARFDPFFQVCFAATYYDLHNAIGSQYESASTSAFKGGRTECIRGNTREVAAFAKALHDTNVSDADKYKLLKAAVQKHYDLTVEALMGKGSERHLFGLKKQAERDGVPIPALFTDKGYSELNSNMLSTSTLVHPLLSLGGFGPVSDGYGVGCGTKSKVSLLNTVSFEQKPEEFTSQFWKNLELMGDLQAKFGKKEGGK